jgi:hypothetical protein
MRVLFAPDYREGNRYQDLLAQALERQGVAKRNDQLAIAMTLDSILLDFVGKLLRSCL